MRECKTRVGAVGDKRWKNVHQQFWRLRFSLKGSAERSGVGAQISPRGSAELRDRVWILKKGKIQSSHLVSRRGFQEGQGDVSVYVILMIIISRIASTRSKENTGGSGHFFWLVEPSLMLEASETAEQRAPFTGITAPPCSLSLYLFLSLTHTSCNNLSSQMCTEN